MTVKVHTHVASHERQLQGRRCCSSLVLLLIALFVAVSQSGCAGIAAKSAISNAVANALNASISALNFGNVAVGGTSTLSVTFTNSQSTSIDVSNVIVSGAGFNASGVSAGSIIGPGQSATLNVTCTPAAVGNVNGSVTLISNANNASITIPLSASAVQAVAHSAALSWNASTSSVNGYFIYRAAAPGGPFAKLTSALDPSTSFVDSSVLSGQTYYYVVTAVDSNNTESVSSNEASALIPTP
jgi:ASPM-SPD-2-Hydin domain-containing protein